MAANTPFALSTPTFFLSLLNNVTLPLNAYELPMIGCIKYQKTALIPAQTISSAL